MAMTPSPVKKRILIVEDESSFRMLLQACLRQAGYDTFACASGDQAQTKLRQDKFDMIIMDYLLPGPNAIDVITFARSINVNVPIVVITGFPSEELAIACKKLGVARLLTKASFDAAAIPELARELIG